MGLSFAGAAEGGATRFHAVWRGQRLIFFFNKHMLTRPVIGIKSRVPLTAHFVAGFPGGIQCLGPPRLYLLQVTAREQMRPWAWVSSHGGSANGSSEGDRKSLPAK
jgi:hypothetical protein